MGVFRKNLRIHHVAEVDVELVEDESEWSPYLSVEGAYKLDDVRESDLALASRCGRIYELRPIAHLGRG